MIDHSTQVVDATRLQIVLEILIVFIPLGISGMIGNRIGGDKVGGVATIYLGYIVSIIAATYVLKQHGTAWHQIGMNWPDSWLRTALIGAGVLFGAVAATIVVQVIAINLPGLSQIDESRFNPVAGNLPLLIGMIIAAWTIIAFGEEMLWRAFLLTKLDDLFGQTHIGVILAVIAGSIAFGLAHYVEGPVGIVNTAAIGLVFAVAFLHSNLWVTIIAHALLNTVRFTMLYFAVQGS